MSQTAIESFSVTQRSLDARADGGTRLVHVSAERIVIERIVQKVRMKVAVPVEGYRGLVLSVRLSSATASLSLRHDDREHDVSLDSGDAIEVARKAKAWGALFGHQIAVEEACVAIRAPFARQRSRAKPSRRSQFGRRRKIGDAARLAVSFGGEREIIARN